MCWNAEVSLNTFLFSFFVLCLIIYNNTYTKYKIKELNNVWLYLFFASFIFIQLIEFFIWKNIHNKHYNHILTILRNILLLFQPFFSLMTISNIHLRNKLLVGFFFFSLVYIYFYINNSVVNSKLSKQNHLLWFEDTNYIWLLWGFFFLFGFFYEKFWVGIYTGIITLLLSIYNYYNDKTYASMWCWIANGVMVYYACYLLFYLPFVLK